MKRLSTIEGEVLGYLCQLLPETTGGELVALAERACAGLLGDQCICSVDRTSVDLVRFAELIANRHRYEQTRDNRQ